MAMNLETSAECNEEKLQQERRVFFVRHGEGHHNATEDWSLLDPKLTEKGQAQATSLAGHKELELRHGSLLVVSPLSRAIETALCGFPQIAEKEKTETEFRIVLSPLHSERVGAPCDIGRSKSALLKDYPCISQWSGFDDLQEEWTKTVENDKDWRTRRVPQFLEWLKEQPESHIVVIGHGCFFGDRGLLGRYLQNCEFAAMYPQKVSR
eukprot:TRINITY_DN102137_c0_g1_i1.p1 TRINITY_DN102137_c0_g1~~TRINITY_DN102137_c0_g1_i1.p1  ORF type:complete len:235 (-),score=47.50 TRINITY_DN102137_c0_g1_i1:94-720(-)